MEHKMRQQHRIHNREVLMGRGSWRRNIGWRKIGRGKAYPYNSVKRGWSRLDADLGFLNRFWTARA
jgi:hypothetical protein